MTTQLLSTSEHDLERAAALIKAGGLVGIPTETVYGLGANGLDPEAVKKIFLAKGRPQDNPLILHIHDASQLPDFCREVPESALLLAKTYWPGPLTMILPVRDIVPKTTTAGLDTVGVRCPANDATREIIRLSGVPIAAPPASPPPPPPSTCCTIWTAGSTPLWTADPAGWGWNPPSWTSPAPCPGCSAPAGSAPRS